MTKDEDFKLLKIQTCVLRVNIHCDGCEEKVKKILQRMEGVYKVSIDVDQQKVTISGTIDSNSLIKKLIRAGKHAEPWSQKPSHNLKHKPACTKEDNKNKNKGIKNVQKPMKNLESLKNQQKFDGDSPDEDDEFHGEHEMQQLLLREKMNQLAFLKQQAEANGKKNGGPDNGPNKNMALRGNQNRLAEQRMFSRGVKMNNPQFGGANMKNLGEVDEIGSMMNLAGFQANRVNNRLSSASFNTNNPCSLGMINANNHGLNHFNNPAMMMMNLQQRPSTQTMYNRSPFGPPSTTGYYYNYGPVSYPTVPYSLNELGYAGGPDTRSGYACRDMFSDENTSGCSVM